MTIIYIWSKVVTHMGRTVFLKWRVHCYIYMFTLRKHIFPEEVINQFNIFYVL